MSTVAQPVLAPRWRPSARVLWLPLFLAAVVAGLWLFPQFWYVRSDPATGRVWLTCVTNLPGWTCRALPMADTVESVLAADELVDRELTSPKGEVVRMFSAKRFKESGDEVGLFAHTPDRCWVAAGWKVEPVMPETVELKLHGLPITFERRIFYYPGHRELVYFGGMVGGQPLPYRLDHSLSTSVKLQLQSARDATGTTTRAVDGLLWRRVLDSFVSRRALVGPKQFIRASTELSGKTVEQADEWLQSSLASLLLPADYQQEIAANQGRPRQSSVAVTRHP